MAKHFLINESELSVGEKDVFELDDEKIILYRLDDGFYATETKCPHLGAPLSRGKIVDNNIQCKFHRAEFDIRTGKVCQWANFPPGIQALNFIRGKKDLQTYPVNVEDGKVFVELA